MVAGELRQRRNRLADEAFRAVRAGVRSIEHGSLMAGQSVGLVRRSEPTAAIIAELVEQAARALARDVPSELDAGEAA